MSYDINIQKDEEYSEQADTKAIKTFIASMSDMAPNGEQGFSYGDGKAFWMEIDLEFMEEDEDSIEVEDKITLISCHVPYAFWDDSKASEYFAVCSNIAKHLNWQATDAQTDEPIV